MGAQIGDLLSNKVTRVQREFETKSGIYNLDLQVTHKRITTALQSQLQQIADTEFKKLSASLDARKAAINEAQKSGKQMDLESIPIYVPRNVACLQLELLVLDLDIIDEKKKPIKPTYDNLASLPVEVTAAIKEELDNSVLPKKKTSTTLANGMLQEGDGDVPQIG